MPVSVMFADVKGSTTLAESMPAPDFTSLIDRFYEVSFDVVDASRGVIDHMAGDGVMAMWVPAFTSNHPHFALEAGRAMLSETSHAFGDGLPIGVGVHTGKAHVGVIGHRDSLDFTVIGDVPNTVARLSSEAAPGELLVSHDVVSAIKLDVTEMKAAQLDLRGKEQSVQVWRQGNAG